MNRLTKRHNNGVSWNGNPDHSTQVRYRELLERLAEYEDVGLMPEQTRRLIDGISLERLEQICDAEREGRLNIRPCREWRGVKK